MPAGVYSRRKRSRKVTKGKQFTGWHLSQLCECFLSYVKVRIFPKPKTLPKNSLLLHALINQTVRGEKKGICNFPQQWISFLLHVTWKHATAEKLFSLHLIGDLSPRVESQSCRSYRRQVVEMISLLHLSSLFSSLFHEHPYTSAPEARALSVDDINGWVSDEKMMKLGNWTLFNVHFITTALVS